MKTIKRLGIWMDHSSAHLIEFTAESVDAKTIDSKFTHQEKEQSLRKSENLMHNKEQQQQGAYYKQLGAAIKNYEEVLLFGPTDAKTELYNILSEDQHFKNIKIEVKQADNMTTHQEQAFVNAYFLEQ